MAYIKPKFLLTSFDYLRPKDPSISLASSSILASLLQFGKLNVSHKQYNVRRADMAQIQREFEKDVADIKPDFIGVGIYIWNDRYVSKVFCDSLHQIYRAQNMSKPNIICGGPQITYAGVGVEQEYPFCDIFIRGYAEQSLVQVLDNLITGKQISIQGVHFKGEVDTGTKSVYNFENLQSPFLTKGLGLGHKNFLRLETKRGCPFTCSFCQHKDSYEKRGSCPQGRVEKEIQWLVEQGIRDISIVDPIFNSGRGDYLKTLKSFLDYGFKGRLSLQSRFEMMSSEYLELCSALLTAGVNVELEFGIQTINKEECRVIRRGNNISKIVKAAAELREREIPFETSLIYGLPLQTLDSFRGGVDWVLEFIRPSIALHCWPLMLLKGTGLYEVKEEYGLKERILDEDLEEILEQKRIYAGIPHVVQSSTFSEEDWQEMKRTAGDVLKSFNK